MQANGTPLSRTYEPKLTDSFVYEITRFLGSPFSYDLIGYENILNPGPAIFITNHLGAIGPIQVILSVPIRLYPWVIAEMTDFKRAPKYLFDDFVQPVLHLKGRFGLLFSTFLTKISVRLFHAIGVISIDRFGGMTTDGFRHSLRLLREGKNLLIFPEDPLLPLDPETLMRHFMPGFATLCNLFQAEQETLLPVYPLAVHSGSETVSIGKPEYFRPQANHREAIDDFSRLVEERVRRLFLELQKNCDDILE